MIWHIVRFDFDGIDDAVRDDLEERLRELDALDCVGFLRLGRDLDQATVTGLLTGFADADALATYRDHPRHVPVVEAIRDAGVRVSRLDVRTDDDLAVLA